MTASPTPTPLARSAPHLLGVLTFKLGIGLLLLWLARTIFTRLPFAQTIRLPEVPFSLAEIVTVVLYLIAFVMLLSYARVLGPLWPQAYPQEGSLAPALTSLVYLAALVVGYWALEVLVSVFGDETALLVLQAFALILALVLLVRAGVTSYRYLPYWFSGLRIGAASGAAQVACLHCGRLNMADFIYCGHCGQPLKRAT